MDKKLINFDVRAVNFSNYIEDINQFHKLWTIGLMESAECFTACGLGHINETWK